VARHFTRSTLRGWGLEVLVEDASVVVTELLSNAVRHGLASPRDASGAPQLLGLGLLRRGATVLCAISDPGADLPVLREPDGLTESGRGLFIVGALSESWGWTPHHRAGKAVWALLSAADRL
jgi:anti-sigma regulatory factor (Ser/Thr protein kinase)